MQPFAFTDDKEKNRDTLKRFEQAARRGKPADEEYRKRLDFYLHRQTNHVLEAVKLSCPNTWREIEPYLTTIRVVRMLVDERAKVFMHGSGLVLANEDGPLDPQDDEAKRWADVQDAASLALNLKLCDRYATLDGTVFLRFSRMEGEGLQAHIFFPDHVDVVPDPFDPFNLDRAYGVRLLIDGEGDSARYEFWCARKGEEQYRIVHSDGTVEPVAGNEKGANPYVDEDGNAIVPVVMFTDHGRELGIFTDAGQGLWKANLAIDKTVTDIHHMAAMQGFGIVTVSYPEGREPAPGSAFVVGPGKVLELKQGATAGTLAPSPQIDALLNLVDKDIKRAALTYGVPPGAVSLEARTVASGIALQIEMRPLLEARTDAIDYYRAPMKRAWRIAKAVHNARAEDGEKFKADARWEPGEVQMPESEDALIDRMMVLRKAGWLSDVQAIAKLRKLSSGEAAKALAQIAEENGGETAEPMDDGPDDGEDPLVVDMAAARAKLGKPSEPDEVEPAEAPASPGAPPASKAAEVQAQAVDPTTALNGAQVAALVEVVEKVASGQIPRASGIEIIVASFPVSREDAERIMGEVGRGFVPKEETPPPAG